MEKTIKLELLKPVNATWKEAGQVLRDVQFAVAKCMNIAMTEYYLYQQKVDDWRRDNGCVKGDKKMPTKDEVPPPEHKTRLYHHLRSLFPDVQSKSISSVCQIAMKKWRSSLMDVFYRQAQALPTFKKTFPIPLTGDQWSLCEKDGEFIFSAGILSTKAKKEGKTVRFDFVIRSRKIDPGTMANLERIMTAGKNKAAKLKYIESKNKWCVLLSYVPEVKENPGLQKHICCGVDLGVATAFSCRIFDNERMKYGASMYQQGGEVDAYRKKIRNMRKNIQRQSAVSGRTGKGRNRILAPSEKMAKKEHNFADTVNHRYSKAIVDFAKENNAGVIQMENLKTMRENISKSSDEKDNPYKSYFFMKDWPLYDLLQKIKYKAELEGMEVREVDPKYTSQRCSRCGVIRKENREKDSYKCEVCGMRMHADANAACNLAVFGIDAQIKEFLKFAGSAGEAKSQLPLAN